MGGVTVRCDWVVGAGGRYTLDEEPPGIAGRAGLARWRWQLEELNRHRLDLTCGSHKFLLYGCVACTSHP